MTQQPNSHRYKQLVKEWERKSRLKHGNFFSINSDLEAPNVFDREKCEDITQNDDCRLSHKKSSDHDVTQENEKKKLKSEVNSNEDDLLNIAFITGMSFNASTVSGSQKSQINMNMGRKKSEDNEIEEKDLSESTKFKRLPLLSNNEIDLNNAGFLSVEARRAKRKYVPCQDICYQPAPLVNEHGKNQVKTSPLPSYIRNPTSVLGYPSLSQLPVPNRKSNSSFDSSCSFSGSEFSESSSSSLDEFINSHIYHDLSPIEEVDSNLSVSISNQSASISSLAIERVTKQMQCSETSPKPLDSAYSSLRQSPHSKVCKSVESAALFSPLIKNCSGLKFSYADALKRTENKVASYESNAFFPSDFNAKDFVTESLGAKVADDNLVVPIAEDTSMQFTSSKNFSSYRKTNLMDEPELTFVDYTRDTTAFNSTCMHQSQLTTVKKSTSQDKTLTALISELCDVHLPNDDDDKENSQVSVLESITPSIPYNPVTHSSDAASQSMISFLQHEMSCYGDDTNRISALPPCKRKNVNSDDFKIRTKRLWNNLEENMQKKMVVEKRSEIILNRKKMMEFGKKLQEFSPKKKLQKH